MIISPEHSELKQKYQKLLLKSMQQEKFLEKAQENYQQVASKITTLQNFVDDITSKYKELQVQYAQAMNIIADKDKQLQRLALIEHQYLQLQRLMYARSSEKSTVTPGQLLLELDAEIVEACNINDGQKIESYTKHKTVRQKHPGRNQIPAHLPRTYVDIYPDNLPEDAELFDTIETEQLEYDPAKLFATVYRRFKYKRAKEDGSTEFFIATLPEEKDKSIAAPSLKAHVTTEKYMWHMPIHRQMQKFSSVGIILNENTIGDWINGTCRNLTALYDEHRKAIVHPACGYIMADETGITVLDSEKGKGKKSHTGYMWAYCNPVDKLVFFEYQKGRGNKHARPVLEHYKGYLHTDGYNVYKHYGGFPGVTHLNCNAHARRKFYEAKFTDRKRAEHAIMLYGKLYGVESYCKEMGLSFDERKRLREEKSTPVFEELKTWVRDEIPKLITFKKPHRQSIGLFF